MASAEVLPIVLEGQDNTASAWASFIRNGKSAQSVIDQLKGSAASLASGSASSLASLGNAAKMLANPYVAVTAAVLGVSGAAVLAANDLAKIGDAADMVGTKGSSIAGLGSELRKVGGDAGDAIAGLKNLRAQLDLQSRDGGYIENIFKQNKSSIYDAAGELKPLNEIYAKLSGYIFNAKNDTIALEIATHAFGEQAAPAIVKAIDGGARSLDKLANTDLDPLIKQSQEVERIWNSLGKSDGSWLQKAEGWAAQFGDKLKLAGAAMAGSKEAINMQDRLNRPELYENNGSNPNYVTKLGPSELRSGSAGLKGDVTKTQSNRPEQSTAAYDKASVAVAKHTAEVYANASAVELGAGELANMETQAKLLATAEESGLKVTQKMRDEIKKLADGAGAAAEALAKAKAASEINFGRNTAFLTPDDVAIATSLKGIYGTDIPAALNSTEAAAMRVNNVLKDIGTTGQDINKGMIVGLEQGLRSGLTFAQSEAKAAENELGKVADKLASMAADNLWKAAFGGSGGFNVLSALGIGSFGNNADANPGSASNPLSGLDSSDYDPGGFADGGFTGIGGKYQPAGIVHRGEFVFDADSTRRIGPGNLWRMMKGYADGGLVDGPGALANIPAPKATTNITHNTITVDVRGATGNEEVQRMVTVGMQKAYNMAVGTAVASVPGVTGDDRKRRG
jgi:hypothetical protein